MNNRIFEIAHQVLPREDHLIEADHKEYAYFFASHELQQFAELIIEKCYEWAKENGGISGPIDYAALKEHFGVE
jgi:hypothetical protein